MTLDQAIETPADQLPKLPRPDRRNLDFEFQSIPPGLREEDPGAFQRLRFAAMLELLDFETADLPYQTRQAMKAKAANFTNFIQNTKSGIRHEMPPAGKRLFNFWVDNLAAMGWNVLDHYFKARDQRVFIHLIHLFESGLISLPGCDKPLNQCSFEEVVAAERGEEEQYWKEMQRRGEFVALTSEDLIPGADAKPLEELTLDDFTLARTAIQKARLIAYGAPDGRRLVFKDTVQTAIEQLQPD